MRDSSSRRGFSVLAGLALLAASSMAAAQVDSLRIMAPAAPGGGWDGTSRAMQAALMDAGIVNQVEVFNVPGAGGTIGLAQLASSESGNGDILMMMGLVMVGSILTSDAQVGLDQSTPIARLTAEYEVIVGPASSPYQTLADLIEAFQADPGAVAFAGGSAGGIDHILVGLLAEETGVDPSSINYIPYTGGGGARAAMLGSQGGAGVAGYSAALWQCSWAARWPPAPPATPSGRGRSRPACCVSSRSRHRSGWRASTPRRGWSRASNSTSPTGAAWSRRPASRPMSVTPWSPPS